MCSHVCLYVYSDQLIAAGAPRKHPCLNRATLACLLYPTRRTLIASFNNSKTKLRTKFCQRKNRLRIDSRMCHFKDTEVILNHPVYIQCLPKVWKPLNISKNTHFYKKFHTKVIGFYLAHYTATLL